MSKKKKKKKETPGEYHQLSFDFSFPEPSSNSLKVNELDNTLGSDISSEGKQNKKKNKKNSDFAKEIKPSISEISPPQKVTSSLENYVIEKSHEKNKRLFLPVTYEEIRNEVRSGEKQSRLPDVIVPLPEFEAKIIQIIADIKSSGHLVFLYGPSGVGKSTFIISLEFQGHIPIKEIFSVDTTKLVENDNPSLKLQKLFQEINQKARTFFEKKYQ